MEKKALNIICTVNDNYAPFCGVTKLLFLRIKRVSGQVFEPSIIDIE